MCETWQEGNGIWNFCDQWCERCELAPQCPESRSGSAGAEVAAFWHRQRQALPRALEIAERAARGWGFPDELLLAPSEDSPVIRIAWLYARQTHECLSHVRTNGSSRVLAEAGDGLREALEVVEWYPLRIVAKLMHAQGMATGAERSWEQTLANGSAKVALLGIERSMAAWAIVAEQHPLARERAEGQLVRLSLLRQLVEEAFPLAHRFRRPGFESPQ